MRVINRTTYLAVPVLLLAKLRSGLIDDHCIYDQALSAEEIEELAH